MSVFVLGGKAKGFKIQLPQKVDFRPTSVMLRRKFFDLKQNWEGVEFYDLFAGSGVIGLEALSRGANSIHFSDTSAHTLKLLQQNCHAWIERFPEDQNAITLEKKDALTILEGDIWSNESWIFFDPPYQKENIYEKFMQLLLTKPTLNFAGIVIEFEMRKGHSPSWLGLLEEFRRLKTFRELQSADRKLLIIQGA
jgi:16S rRNA (guanine966-N2)-methyltransferase